MPRIAVDRGAIRQVATDLRMQLHTVITELTNAGKSGRWTSDASVSLCLAWYRDFHGRKAAVIKV